MVNIHYFYDPVCGWCYGASSLIEALESSEHFNVIYHPGGMMDKVSISKDFREHILAADERIKQLAAVEFSEDYIDKVQSADELVLDSMLAIRAILVNELLGVKEHFSLAKLQEAHYKKALDIGDIEVLARIARELGLEQVRWYELMAQSINALQLKLENSARLMQQLQVGGYPTLVIEEAGEFTRLNYQEFYSEGVHWVKALEAQYLSQ